MSQFYAGMDVSDLETTLCVIDGEGTIMHEAKVPSTPPAITQALKPYRKMLSKVGLEAGVLSPWLPRELSRRGLPVVCLDTRSARAALGAQRNKTDKNDARGIAQVLRAGWYGLAHVKSIESMRTRLLLTHRRALKRKARDIEACLRTSLKAFGVRTTKKGESITLQKSRAANDSFLIKLAASMLRARQALLSEVDKLDDIVLAAARADAVCRRLMTVPGVGPITALAYRAGVDEPSRFKSSRAVAAHFGLTPRRFQSGQTDISGHISRIGDEMVRTALYEAAFVLLVVSKSKCALRVWGLRLKEQKGMRRAVVACARKLAVVLHKMWITGRDFNDAPPHDLDAAVPRRLPPAKRTPAGERR